MSACGLLENGGAGPSHFETAPVAATRCSAMHRRTFCGSVACAFVAALPAVRAQQAAKVYRVGLVANAAPVSELAGPNPAGLTFRAFVHGLRALGYVEGQNLVLERRSAEGISGRFDEIAAELARLNVDVIVTASDTMTRAAHAASTTIPIVMTLGGDPVAGGLVQSLARPGGNITGLTFQVGPEIDAKRLHLLREMLPGASRIAFLANSEEGSWESPSGRSVRAAAQAMGLTLVRFEAARDGYTDALRQVSLARVDALFAARSSHAYVHRSLIVDFVTRSRLPSSFDNRDFIAPGGLMSFGANPTTNFARAAGYVDRILKGAHPGDLPIEQPTKYELLINLKTARALGLAIPRSLLLRADELIE